MLKFGILYQEASQMPFWAFSHPKTPPDRTILMSNLSKNSNLKSLLFTLTQSYLLYRIILLINQNEAEWSPLQNAYT